jgi:hypothetical protein
MPIIKQAGAQPANPLQNSFVERIKAGRVVPVLSGEATVELVFGSFSDLVKGYAGLAQYPMADQDNLVKVAKYRQLREGLPDRALKSDYLNWVKNYIYYTAKEHGADEDLRAEAEAEVDDLTVSAFASRLGYPRFDGGPADPLLMIAGLPSRVYLTTSPMTLLEDALQRAGREPRTELCRWHRTLDGIDSAIDATYHPSAREPLVYHLHGLDAYPDSLVLTEDDHLEFLVNICQNQGNNAADRIHALVRQALLDDLILLGYSLSGWAFRDIYAGLIKTGGREDDRGVCALQLVPTGEERRYLEDYARREAKFDVFWGDLGQYAAELRKMLGDS